MAFIVEMWWGKPHEIAVQDLDENGDWYVREVIPNGPPDPERRAFSCAGTNWEAALDLGCRFGWEPKGALFRRWHEVGAPARDFSYKPDGWLRGIHEVEADDARTWGVALETCVREVDEGRFELPAIAGAVLLREGMTANEFRQANRGLTVQFLRSFAAFLHKGAFRFGWDS